MQPDRAAGDAIGPEVPSRQVTRPGRRRLDADNDPPGSARSASARDVCPFPIALGWRDDPGWTGEGIGTVWIGDPVAMTGRRGSEMRRPGWLRSNTRGRG